MFDIFSYTFFQNAVIGIMLVSIASAIIGTYVVCRRMVFVTGGITHASFGGLGLGFYAGLSPALTAYAPKAMRSAVPMVSTLPNRNDDNSGT